MESWSDRTGNGGGPYPLTPAEARAAEEVVHRVRRYVPAELVQALLFGSKARRASRPDSDVDLLLIFRDLPPDREPQASIAEEIAEEIADHAGVPVSPWSVSLQDLEEGMRTPMLVDALQDGVPLWPREEPPPQLHFTPADALRCTAALLQRIEEGSAEVAQDLVAGDWPAAIRRARDDLVRLCTAALLLKGETRPRRAQAVRRFMDAYVAPGLFPADSLPLLQWAADSFGPDGKDEDRPLYLEPEELAALFGLVDQLRAWLAWRRARLVEQFGPPGNTSERSA
jgi:predicted nucleotidyltransferase